MILAKNTHPSSAACFVELNAAVEAMTWRRVCLNAHWATPPAGSIVFNTESVPDQVDPERWRGFECWDSIASNVAKYPAGMNVKHVPVGYHPSMERFKRAEVLDIDVVFTGALNERRSAVLDALRAKGLNVVWLGPAMGNHGAARDAVLARSKLALNILFHDKAPFPATRCAHLVANRVPVLSELCPGMWGFLDASHAATDLEHMVDDAEGWLRGGNADGDAAWHLKAMAEKHYEAFKAMPMVLPS